MHPTPSNRTSFAMSNHLSPQLQLPNLHMRGRVWNLVLERTVRVGVRVEGLNSSIQHVREPEQQGEEEDDEDDQSTVDAGG